MATRTIKRLFRQYFRNGPQFYVLCISFPFSHGTPCKIHLLCVVVFTRSRLLSARRAHIKIVNFAHAMPPVFSFAPCVCVFAASLSLNHTHLNAGHTYNMRPYVAVFRICGHGTPLRVVYVFQSVKERFRLACYFVVNVPNRTRTLRIMSVFVWPHFAALLTPFRMFASPILCARLHTGVILWARLTCTEWPLFRPHPWPCFTRP